MPSLLDQGTTESTVLYSFFSHILFIMVFTGNFVVLAASALAAAVAAPSASAFTALQTARSAVPAPFRSQSQLRASTVASTSTSNAVSSSPPPMSPLTAWGEPYADIVAVQQAAKKIPLAEFGPEVSAVVLGLSNDIDAQLSYFTANRASIMQQMQDHGCIVFRDFDLMKSQDGFQDFYAALGLKCCLDPLHSVAARPTVNGDKNSPVYEAVNKESRKNFFIGMHNEFVGTRAPRAAAFCCFKPAEEGGEFLIADGRRIFRDLPADLLSTLYNRQIRYSVMELPFFAWIDTLPEFIQQPVAAAVQGLVSTAINIKVDFDVELRWGVSDYDGGVKMLQARAPRQPPVVPHPVTNDPTWFCNVHSHSSSLRHAREQMYVPAQTSDSPYLFQRFTSDEIAINFDLFL